MADDTTITRIPIDPEARREGYRAGRLGQSPEHNPYHVGTCEALAWNLGLAVGRRKRLQIVSATGRKSD